LNFCASLFEFGDKGKSFFMMSTNAHQHFTKEQFELIEKYGKILKVKANSLERLTNYGIDNLFSPLF
jgi:hypothetical protein